MSQAGIISLTSQPIVNPNQPIFSAWASASQANVTGDSTIYTVKFDQVTVNQKNGYDGINTFTAPVTGNYLFNWNIMMTGATSSNDTGWVRLQTTSQDYFGLRLAPAKVFDGSTIFSLNGSVIVPMTSGNTAFIQIIVTGSVTKNINITVNGTDALTYFSGALIG